MKEVRELVDFLRAEDYLDGPTDVDWIFPNNILTRREESLYVDYVRYENDTCSWTGPAERAAIRDELFGHSQRASNVIRLVGAMHRTLLPTAQGFEAASIAWQEVTLNDAFHGARPTPSTTQ